MKYKLLQNDTKNIGDNTILYRIQYIRNVKSIKSGTLGGYIEKESNFCQDDDSLVLDNVKVDGNAVVYGNAVVCGDALVYGNALVYGDALVYGNAVVSGDAHVCGNARVYDNACVREDALVYGNAVVYGNAQVCGDAQVYGDAEVYGNASVYGDAKVEKSPIIIMNFKHTICITETHIFIGCEGHTIKHWKKNIVEIGRKNNYTNNEIKKVIDYLKISTRKV